MESNVLRQIYVLTISSHYLQVNVKNVRDTGTYLQMETFVLNGGALNERFYLKMEHVNNVNPIQRNRMITHASLRFATSSLCLKLLELVKNAPTMYLKRMIENVQLQVLVVKIKF